MDGEVSGESPTECGGQEAGKDVEEDEGGEEARDAQCRIGLGDLKLLLELGQGRVLGELQSHLCIIISKKKNINKIEYWEWFYLFVDLSYVIVELILGRHDGLQLESELKKKGF